MKRKKLILMKIKYVKRTVESVTTESMCAKMPPKKIQLHVFDERGDSDANPVSFEGTAKGILSIPKGRK